MKTLISATIHPPGSATDDTREQLGIPPMLTVEVVQDDQYPQPALKLSALGIVHDRYELSDLLIDLAAGVTSIIQEGDQ